MQKKACHIHMCLSGTFCETQKDGLLTCSDLHAKFASLLMEIISTIILLLIHQLV